MVRIRMAGVPEHFNYLWHLLIQNGYLHSHGIELDWIDVPSGTGKMVDMLIHGETDLAIVLSEGFVHALYQGKPLTVLGNYVESPLPWGVFTGTSNTLHWPMDISKSRFAISRLGSGSHLMGKLCAQKYGFELKDSQFIEIQNLEGAKKALIAQEADYFLWEELTTKHLVEQGLFRQVDTFPSPWPAFVFAAHSDCIPVNQTIVDLVNLFYAFMKSYSVTESDMHMIAEKYRHSVEDVRMWHSKTKWAQTSGIDVQSLAQIANVLYPKKNQPPFQLHLFKSL
jgi:sulfonate transport system substrate-binding protein